MTTLMRRTMSIGLGLTLGLAVALFVSRPRSVPTFHGSLMPTALPAPALDLHGLQGESISVVGDRGELTILFFGFTSCPDVCPATLTRVSTALAGLPEHHRSRVRVLFVSIDPRNDTPQRIRSFLDEFDPSFVGVLGDSLATARAADAYHVYFTTAPANGADAQMVDHTAHSTTDPVTTDPVTAGAPVPAAGAAAETTVLHSASGFVIDGAGRLRLTFPNGLGVPEIASDLVMLLEEERP